MAWNTEQAAEIMHWMDSPEDRQASAEEGTDPRLDPEDYALLLRAWQKRMGPLRDRKRKPLRHVHIVLDEVQDFSPVEVQVLLDTTEKNQSVTLAGDVRQHISEQAGFSTAGLGPHRHRIDRSQHLQVITDHSSHYPFCAQVLMTTMNQRHEPPAMGHLSTVSGLWTTAPAGLVEVPVIEQELLAMWRSPITELSDLPVIDSSRLPMCAVMNLACSGHRRGDLPGQRLIRYVVIMNPARHS